LCIIYLLLFLRVIILLLLFFCSKRNTHWLFVDHDLLVFITTTPLWDAYNARIVYSSPKLYYYYYHYYNTDNNKKWKKKNSTRWYILYTHAFCQRARARASRRRVASFFFVLNVFLILIHSPWQSRLKMFTRIVGNRIVTARARPLYIKLYLPRAYFCPHRPNIRCYYYRIRSNTYIHTRTRWIDIIKLKSQFENAKFILT